MEVQARNEEGRLMDLIGPFLLGYILVIYAEWRIDRWMCP